jgi:hypothetical protein
VLTASEKRFIKSWEEQREGGKVKFYLLYILMGTFVATLTLSFLTQILSMALVENFWFILIGSFCIVTIATVFGWWRNEKKFKTIIQREIRDGKLRDEGEATWS